MNSTKQKTSHRDPTGMVGIAAIGSILAASSCCLPVLPFVFAASFAGSAAFITAFRPYLLAVSAGLVAFGFYQAWRANRCRARRSIISLVLLWTSAVFLAAAIFFPQVLPNIAADLLAR